MRSGGKSGLVSLLYSADSASPAAALLAASSESYNAALQSYNYGVRSQIDVVSAQRALAAARTADVSARTQLLTGISSLAFQTGDLLHHAKGS